MRNIGLRLATAIVLIVACSGLYLTGQGFGLGSPVPATLAAPAVTCGGNMDSTVATAATAAAQATTTPASYLAAVTSLQSAWQSAATTTALAAKSNTSSANSTATAFAQATGTTYASTATAAAKMATAALTAVPATARAGAKSTMAAAYTAVAVMANAQKTVQAAGAKAVATTFALQTATAAANGKALYAWDVSAAKTAVKANTDAVSAAGTAAAQATTIAALSGNARSTAVVKATVTAAAKQTATANAPATPAVVKVSPIDTYNGAASDCVVTLMAGGSGTGTVGQWQVNEQDGHGWRTITASTLTYPSAPSANLYTQAGDTTNTLTFTGTASLMDGYQYRALLTNDAGGAVTNVATLHFPPTITGLSPATGSTMGGGTVLITGTGFLNVLAVDFGTVAATYQISGTTNLIVTTPFSIPPPPTGVALPVSVTTKSGTATDSGAWTWTAPVISVTGTPSNVITPSTSATATLNPSVPAPMLSNVDTITGPDTGGTTVHITGNGFTGATAVNFGHASTTNVTVTDSSDLTAVSPAMVSPDTDGTGVVISVRGPGGTSSGQPVFKFTYTAPPPIATPLPGRGGITNKWYWQNPLPQGNTLNGVYCFSSTSCLAVGDAGTMQVTTDGGATWTGRASGTTANLAGITCPTAQNCLVWGGSGSATVILASADGGATWSSKAAPAITDDASSIDAVACTSASACIAVGGNFTVTTTNGGTSWDTLHTTANAVGGIACPSASTCLATEGSGVMVSTDAGTTWGTPVSVSTEPLSTITCPDTSHCFAVGMDASSMGTIRATTDGGATWTNQYDNLSSTLLLHGIACTSDSDCFAVGDADQVLATTDGGTLSGSDYTWTVQGAGGDTDGMKAIACPSANTCVAVGVHGNILYTTDGTNWTWQNQSTSLTEVNLTGISCVDYLNCTAVSSTGDTLSTTNGGQTWSLTPSSSAGSVAWNGISCTTEQSNGNSGTATCVEAGSVNWANHYTGGYTGNNGTVSITPNRVSCPNTSDCFAVGDGGAIIATTNGNTASYNGVHNMVDSGWAAQTSNTTADLSGISCIDANHCVAVGTFTSSDYTTQNGEIVTTTDGGTTWTSQAVAGTNNLYQVSCMTSTTCIASGSPSYELNATFTLTEASGTWTAKNVNSSSNGGGVSCPDASHCFATTGGGVLATVDGGNTWTIQTVPDAGALNAISCPDAKDCYLAGAGGALLVYRAS